MNFMMNDRELIVFYFKSFTLYPYRYLIKIMFLTGNFDAIKVLGNQCRFIITYAC